MKQVSSEKYNVAWFKLADCVARGEKIRALGVYRLLSHSLPDKALVRQLEGDLRLSFQDRFDALNLYQQAAELYKIDGRLFESAGVYEHLCVLDPHQISYYQALIDIYQHLENSYKVFAVRIKLCEQYISQKLFEQAHEQRLMLDIDFNPTLYTDFQIKLLTDQLGELYAQYICTYLLELKLLGQVSDQLLDDIRATSKKTVDYLLSHSDSRKLVEYSTQLQAINHTYAQEIYSIVQVYKNTKKL